MSAISNRRQSENPKSARERHGPHPLRDIPAPLRSIDVTDFESRYFHVRYFHARHFDLRYFHARHFDLRYFDLRYFDSAGFFSPFDW